MYPALGLPLSRRISRPTKFPTGSSFRVNFGALPEELLPLFLHSRFDRFAFGNPLFGRILANVLGYFQTASSFAPLSGATARQENARKIGSLLLGVNL
jgi:hypothetical protein